MPDVLTLVPGFAVGQRLHYTLTTEQLRNGACVLRADMDVALEVLARESDGWRIRWCASRTVFHELDAERRSLIEAMARLTDGLPFDVRVDDDGHLLGLHDVPAVQAAIARAAQGAVAALAAAEPAHPLLPALQASFARLCATESLLVHSLLKEPRALLGAMGRDYRVGEALEVRTEVPSPLGSGDIPVLGRFAVRRADADRQEAELGWLMVLDTRAAAEIIGRELDALIPGRVPANPWASRMNWAGAQAAPSLDFDDQADFVIDLKTAWPRRVEHRRRIAAGASQRQERLVLVRQPG